MKRSPRPSKTVSNFSDSMHQQCDLHLLRASKEESLHWLLEKFLQAAPCALRLAVLLILATVATRSARAQTYSVMHAFTGPPDGRSPQAPLILDAENNLYGTTESGGVSYGGTVFELDPSGKEKVLYNFLGGYGQNPEAGLLRDEAANLYGTTQRGGAYDQGTVFKLDRKGNETVRHTFTGGSDGALPGAGLVRDEAGNLYGTSTGGDGNVFKLDTAGRETVLYSFIGNADGALPSGVIRDAEGNLYGTANYGGSGCYELGCGIVFMLDKTGRLRVLYSFTGTGGDGAYPSGGVIRDASGNLYGTTYEGGDLSCAPPYGCGTVFVIDNAGKEKVLYAFQGTGQDGEGPYTGVIQDPDGNLYGTTPYGGSAGFGAVFKVDKGGRETVLYSFSGGADGAEPCAGVIRDKEGNLYGTTPYGGDGCDAHLGCGVVFKLSP